jgi:phospholipase C
MADDLVPAHIAVLLSEPGMTFQDTRPWRAHFRLTPDRQHRIAVIIAVVVSILAPGLSLSKFPPPSPSVCNRVQFPASQGLLQHIFVIVKENHAFENYFGSFPGATGYPPTGSFPNSFKGGQVTRPFPLTGTSTPDLPHDHQSGVIDLNGGLNDLFIAQANATGASQPQNAVGFYTAQQLFAYYDYAHYYGLGDGFFSGVLGPTDPNRVFDLTAYIGNWSSNGPPPLDVVSHATILDQLAKSGIPWAYYFTSVSTGLAPTWFPSVTANPCQAHRVAPISDLIGQLSGPQPPSVAFIDPSNSLLYSEHPPENVTLGQLWTVSVIDSILESPVGPSSIILLFWDESGGFWDPVPPPETSTGIDGFRVPLIVISPWTPSGTLCHSTTDPASVLRLIDDSWRLPYLNPRVASAGSLACFLNFSNAPRPPLILPSNVPLSS